MKTEIVDALNEHLQLELRAWYEYSAMALWFDRIDLPGFASFMEKQAGEELAHAHRIIDHLKERDQTAILPALDRPRGEYDSPRHAFEQVLDAEREVTTSIQKIYKLADQAEDQPSRIMLEWFINEQVEEENLARALLGRLRHAGDSGPGLLLVDQELGKGAVPGVVPHEPQP
jgi:ferritin